MAIENLKVKEVLAATAHLADSSAAVPLKSKDYADGGGLSLRVKASGASFVFRYTDASGKRREMGMGAFNRADASGSLAKARKKAKAARDLLEGGADPHTAKQRAKTAKKPAATSGVVTLRRYARNYHERDVEPKLSAKHGVQWITSVERLVPTDLLDMPLIEIRPAQILDALSPIFRGDPEAEPPRKPLRETGSRIYQRLTVIFDDAVTRELRPDNPCLPIRKAIGREAGDREEKHHPSLPYPRMPSFMTQLRAAQGNGPRALEFLILTASRTGEVIGATWDEFDLDAKTWTIPAARMKGRETHTVHLTEPAITLLRAQQGHHASIVFLGQLQRGTSNSRPLSTGAMDNVIDRMGLEGIATVHGFRATFSTWANEVARAREDVIEACLAHKEADRVRRAYNRADFFAERQALLNAWAKFVADDSNVVQFPAQAAA